MPNTVHHTDSFDFYATADIATVWTGKQSNPAIGAFGRLGTNGLRCASTGDGVFKIIAAPEATHYFGFSYKHASTTGANLPIVELKDIGAAVVQVTVRFNTTGRIEVLRGNNGTGTVLGTGTTVFTTGVERHVSVHIVISDTVGVVDVAVNGNPEITLTNQDTRNGAPTGADYFGLCVQGFTASDNMDFDDFWWNNYADFGDARVEYLRPNGNGNSSQFLGSDGNSVDNYLLVDETSQNGDTDYVGSSTPGDIDLYTFTNATPTAGTVHDVSVALCVRKDDAGTRTVRPVTRDGGSNATGASVNIGTTYNYVIEHFITNPVTTNPWALSEVNADEWGMEEVA